MTNANPKRKRVTFEPGHIHLRFGVAPFILALQIYSFFGLLNLFSGLQNESKYSVAS